ncbi:Peptidyl-prolyl cis-trans isomerase FKBP62 [Bienertia sinuspersici]
MSRVMATYQDCEKIKKELRGLLIEKDNVDPEDIGCLFSYIDNLDNPTKLLEHIKEFKEDGNSFFKKGDINSALENYGFAGIFLTCLALEKEEDRETFINTTCVVLLNMAACFLRKKEYFPAGKFCTFVLDLHPTSVKALFRRASAAMELGRLEFAVSDLELAYVIDPSNQEVCKRLGEVKVRFLKEMKNLSENPKVDVRDAMLKVELPSRIGTVLNPTQFKVGGDTTTKLAIVEKEKLKEETNEMIEDVILKGAEKPKEAKGREEVEKPKEVEMKDADCSRKCGKGRALMEPKHRFHNRKNQGSFLNISKRDYSKLTQGKTFQYYNVKSGVVLSMRVVGGQKITTKQGEIQMTNSSFSDSTIICEFKEEVGDNFNDQSLNQCEEKSQTTNSINQPEGEDIIQPIGGSPKVDYSPRNPYEQGHLGFQSGSGKSGKVRGLTTVMRRNKRKNRTRVKNVGRNNYENSRNSPYTSTNHLYQCRFKVEGAEERKEHPQVKNLIHASYQCGQKRKLEPTHLLDHPQQPRKLEILYDKSCRSM